MAFTDGLHNPDALVLGGLFELFKENRVFGGQVIGEGHVVIAGCFFGLALFLEGSLEFLDILG